MRGYLTPGGVMDTWITDTPTSERFPYYTRANADEVGPDPFSPLGWSLIWQQGCIPGVARGFVEFGVLDWAEYDLDPPQVFGNVGGYFYNPLSLSRLMGERMPGVTAATIDQAYFGEHPGVPPYAPHPDDQSQTATARLGETMAWVMSAQAYPEQEQASATARRVVAERPVLASLSDLELVSRARSIAPLVEQAWVPYCVVCLGASLGPGAVQAVCAGLGRPADAAALLSAVGGVESADASFAMWDLGRLIAASEALTRQFDTGIDTGVAGVLGRVAELAAGGDPDAVAFEQGWASLLREHGHRGPNEWDARPHSWTTRPELALGMIDRLRRQTADRSPHDARDRAIAERKRLSAELGELLDGDVETQDTLAAGLASAARWLALRETGKNACIRLIHEAKLALHELGARMVERGLLGDARDVFMLLDDELDVFVTDPASLVDTIREREVAFRALHELEPPYILGGDRPAPPISTWPRRNGGHHQPAVPGEVLQGAQGAPGVVTGRARVVLDPAVAGDLEPGDVLVAPTTDPSWVSLFLAVGGVVTNVGAVGSHAAIVCRELGVPCAVSVVHATDRIPDGAMVSIDGSTGTVTLISI
jgi:phosphohistidine swiveling domain-containing protein